eukprot:20440-Pleurochrysis_carterae.AAC.1
MLGRKLGRALTWARVSLSAQRLCVRGRAAAECGRVRLLAGERGFGSGDAAARCCMRCEPILASRGGRNRAGVVGWRGGGDGEEV